jgi:hypothetical protein
MPKVGCSRWLLVERVRSTARAPHLTQCSRGSRQGSGRWGAWWSRIRGAGHRACPCRAHGSCTPGTWPSTWPPTLRRMEEPKSMAFPSSAHTPHASPRQHMHAPARLTGRGQQALLRAGARRSSWAVGNGVPSVEGELLQLTASQLQTPSRRQTPQVVDVTPAHRIGGSVLLYKVQEALAVGGKRRKAAQSGRAVRANPGAPLAAPHLAELHKPNQGLIRAGNGGFAS